MAESFMTSPQDGLARYGAGAPESPGAGAPPRSIAAMDHERRSVMDAVAEFGCHDYRYSRDCAPDDVRNGPRVALPVMSDQLSLSPDLRHPRG